MKKSRFLALIMVVAVMLMGAGFAYWNDVLTLEVTASSGDLDVEFARPGQTFMEGCCHDCSEYDMTVTPNAEDPDMQEFTIEGMFPGAAFGYQPKMENVGTVSAQWTGLEVNRMAVTNTVLYDAINWELKFKVDKGSRFPGWPGGGGDRFYTLNGTGLGTMESGVEEWLDDNRIIICPEDKLAFDSGHIKFWIPCDEENNQNNLMDKDAHFTMKFTFEQPCCLEEEVEVEEEA